MQPRSRFSNLYLVAALVLFVGVMLLQGYIWPPPKSATQAEVVGMYAGAAATVGMHKDVDVFTAADAERKAQAEERKKEFPSLLGNLGGGLTTAAVEVDAPAKTAEERRNAIVRPTDPDTLIPMGWGEKPYHLQVLLNDRGASIQQIVLKHFQQADREGMAVVNSDLKPRPLYLVPGYTVPRMPTMREQRAVDLPDLVPGKVSADTAKVLAHPSFVMTHYEKADDPQPVDTLGLRKWQKVRDESAGDDAHVIAFETDLGAPFFLKITKTYTLAPTDYHVGLTITLTPTPVPPGAKVETFRYQIDGPRNLPIEGEWYTTTYRQGVVGYPTVRALEEPRVVRWQGGSDRLVSKEGQPIKYAGVMNQYFASVLAVDTVGGKNQDLLDWVRITPEGPPHEKGKLDQTFLDDLTFRAVSKKLEEKDLKGPVTHAFVLYQGPVKVRLLKQMEGDQAVPEETVNRYRDELNLRTLTDAPSPTWIGRRANNLGWSDIVIAFTNLIHSLLGLLSKVIPNMGICVLLITVMVRGLLHPLSRRQAINAKIMQAKTAKLAPDFKKIQEKYGDDMMRVQQEKNKLMREHGINPAAMLGGCLPLLLQMPIFMGLYFALQESVFFRLEPATPWWIHNLAAPDMLIWWGESIPWVSAPEDLGTTLYLGPYFNLLPLIAVGLMMYVQSKMMPKSDDPQVQMQQKTMKIMMIFMLFFFYKSPAGLAIYFIASSIWGMIERKLLPKDIEALEAKRAAKKKEREASRGDRPPGWMGKKMAGFKERMAAIMEEAQKQQQHQRDQRPTTKDPSPNGPQKPPGGPGPGQGKKKKKKR